MKIILGLPLLSLLPHLTTSQSICDEQPFLQQGAGFSAQSELRDEVGELQNLLNEVDEAGLIVDGLFGSGTAQAVRDFQGDSGLAVDGIVGPDTWAAICDEFEGFPDVCEVLPGLEIDDGFLSENKGDLQDEVLQLQELLNEVADAGLDEDGLFGPLTEAAVEAFQDSEGLTVDGVVNDAFWTALCDAAEDNDDADDGECGKKFLFFCKDHDED